jgi:hypothetical protein
MKTLLMILFFASIPTAFSAAGPLKLQCVVYDRHCDANGEMIDEKHEMSAVMKSGENLVTAETATKSGRFTVRGVGIIELKGPKKPKVAIQLYDSQTRSGAAAGTIGVGRPAAERADLVYVYDVNSLDDGDKLFCQSVEANCEFK